MATPTEPQSRPPGRPTWVNVLLVVIAVVVVAVVVKAIAGGGEHGPGRHMQGGDALRNLTQQTWG